MFRVANQSWLIALMTEEACSPDQFICSQLNHDIPAMGLNRKYVLLQTHNGASLLFLTLIHLDYMSNQILRAYAVPDDVDS
jgi:hypothetical protein